MQEKALLLTGDYSSTDDRRAERLLEVAFDDGSQFRLPAEYLRVESPSAEVQGHGPGQKTLVHGRAHVGIIGKELRRRLNADLSVTPE